MSPFTEMKWGPSADPNLGLKRPVLIVIFRALRSQILASPLIFSFSSLMVSYS